VTVAGVMTDNGSCYKAFAFDRACKRLSYAGIWVTARSGGALL
jgi:hypothetical protein